MILSQTLQEVRKPLQVLTEMLRVGRRAIVAFPNFGHWSVRLVTVVRPRAADQAVSRTTGTIRPTSTS